MEVIRDDGLVTALRILIGAHGDEDVERAIFAALPEKMAEKLMLRLIQKFPGAARLHANINIG